MKFVKNTWLPTQDRHFPKYLTEDGLYQHKAFNKAMKHVKDPQVFCDVGAHVGLWSRMARDNGFKRILAFEPIAAFRECYERNVDDGTIRIRLFNKIIGNGGSGRVGYDYLNSGAAKVTIDHNGETIWPLDELIEDEERIDLLKIDVEGMEYEVLKGAKTLIERTKPIIVVEQKSNMKAVEYAIETLGMIKFEKSVDDHILGWE